MPCKNADGTYTAKAAVYVSEYGTLMLFSYPLYRSDVTAHMIQVSEPFEITVSALSDDAVLQGQVDALNAQKMQLQREFNNATHQINTKLSELLCLPHIK